MGKAPWDQRYRELVDYKEKNGTTLVPQSHPVLGQWVHSQRNHYRLKTSGKKSPMTDERLEKLNRIGFCFGTVRGGAATVARRKAALAGGASSRQEQCHDPTQHHPQQQQQQQQNKSESAEVEMDDFGDDEENRNDDDQAQTDVNNNVSTMRGRQDFPHMQHVLDWDRYGTNGS